MKRFSVNVLRVMTWNIQYSDIVIVIVKHDEHIVYVFQESYYIIFSDDVYNLYIEVSAEVFQQIFHLVTPTASYFVCT
jgi:hypothetical protein